MELKTQVIEFIPVVIVGFLIAAYRSLKDYLNEANRPDKTQSEIIPLKTKILTVLTDGVGGSLIGGIIYGLLSVTEYSIIIKICISSVAAFIGIDKVAGWVAQGIKKKAGLE